LLYVARLCAVGCVGGRLIQINSGSADSVNLASEQARILERLQKMIFSLQPCRACIIDGFNSDQFSQGLSLPGLSLPGLSPQ
jgi:hypothetical protein